MAATYSKDLPASVQHLVHAGDRLADVPLHPHSAASPGSSSTSFRQDASSSSTTTTAPFDFDAFREAQGAQLGDRHLDRAWAGAAPSPAPDTAAYPARAVEERGSAQDGAELASLIGGGGLVDAVDGEWEGELLARQHEPWRVELESRMPLDPFAASSSLSSSAKGKGRASEAEPAQAQRAGDMSPTSSELLSSLSSLDLADKAYLRTLLAQDAPTVFDDYFSRGSYTDDVYGLPPAVQRMLDKAAQRDDQVGVEEGRKKAVRRLGMVLRHMQQAGGGSVEAVERQAAGLSLSGGAGLQGAAAPMAAVGQHDSLHQSHMTSMHSRHAPLFASSQHLAQQDAQQNAYHVQQASTTSYADYAVPSSLSESAFITITPPPSSPPAPLAAHAPPAPERPSADTDAELDAPASSTAALLEHHMTRVRSNSEGRFGPAFSRSPSPVEGAAAGGTGADDEQMRAATPSREGEPLANSEGRTH
ncbi:uncharacterized protein RHOBADRAFT_51216 [Rhodotorula graminis WP1]|uniref:Uncharacterized protein n=1 Tax=Rhodotorula graminis (strain WP1) TaxID=578459 RepID=A0A194S9D5_RHOGW|nr:uncharacterized protein RHOBADRAFT_51216 [Rhodotorula graminis WP1]KPV77343.1 hypothetical protein RHOBADRAFT_51216 [Rhodotorula graminis WP1]